MHYYMEKLTLENSNLVLILGDVLSTIISSLNYLVSVYFSHSVLFWFMFIA